MEITAGIIFSIISGIVGLVLILLGIIYRQTIIGRLDKIDTAVESRVDKCSEHRKDIYDRFLTKELFESRSQPLIEKIADVEVELKELSKHLSGKIDNMNFEILGMKGSVVEIQRMLLSMQERQKDK